MQHPVEKASLEQPKKGLWGQTLNSLSKDFWFLSLIIIGITLMLSGYVVMHTISHEKNRIVNILKSQAGRLERTLADSYDYTEHLMRYMGNQIARENEGKNLQGVSHLLHSFKENQTLNNLLSWSTFLWMDASMNVVAEGEHGVLSEPKAMNNREYIKLLKSHPHKLHLGQPVLGIVSQVWALPAGLGVTNAANQFIGAVITGFKISELMLRLEEALTYPGISFALIGTEGVIGYSPDQKFGAYSETLKHQIHTKLARAETEGLLSEPSLFNPTKAFSYFYQSQKYPFILILNYDEFLSQQEFESNFETKVLSVVMLGIVVIIALFFFHMRVVHPIALLAHKVSRLHPDHQLEPIEIKGHTEVVNLGRVINALLARLMTMRKEIVQANETLEQKVLERTQALHKAHQELTQMNENLERKVKERTQDLEKALEAKTEFLNNMSHEIRTPLQNVMAVSEALTEHWQEYSEKEKDKYLGALQQNTERLLALVNNLLDIAKSQSGTLSYKMSQVNFPEIVTETVQECISLAAQKSIHIELSVEKIENKTIMGDEVRLSQVLRNLLSNAINYSENGKIQVMVEPATIKRLDNVLVPAIACHVRDQGKGIPEEEIHSIFGAFTQSSRTKTRAGGTGLGLYLCNQIVKAHQGKIWAKNNEDGKGSTFTVMLPLISLQELNLQKETVVESFNSASVILMIDDEQACLSSVQIMLQHTPYQLVQAANGQTGWEYLKAHPHKVGAVLLDLMMPDIYGLNLLAMMKENPQLQKIPVILQTGAFDQSEIQRAQDLGIVRCLMKPYQRSELLESIKVALEAHSLRDPH